MTFKTLNNKYITKWDAIGLKKANVPKTHFVPQFVKRVRETGMLVDKPTRVILLLKVCVAESMREQRSTSTRYRSREWNISRTSLWSGDIIGPFFFENEDAANESVNGERWRKMLTDWLFEEIVAENLEKHLITAGRLCVPYSECFNQYFAFNPRKLK